MSKKTKSTVAEPSREAGGEVSVSLMGSHPFMEVESCRMGPAPFVDHACGVPSFSNMLVQEKCTADKIAAYIC